jgi:hypothetical protein
MGKTAAKPSTSTSRLRSLSLFLTGEGKLPGFAQRRLDSLIAKKRQKRLTADEQRELTEALDYIDEKSALLLRYAALHQR